MRRFRQLRPLALQKVLFPRKCVGWSADPLAALPCMDRIPIYGFACQILSGQFGIGTVVGSSFRLAQLSGQIGQIAQIANHEGRSGSAKSSVAPARNPKPNNGPI